MGMAAEPDADLDELARRFERFVATLERVRRQPNRREAYHLLVALECFAARDLAGAAQAIRDAERLTALPAVVAALSGIHDHMTTQELRQRLEQTIELPSQT